MEKTQEIPKTGMEQFFKEEGDVDREGNAYGLQQMLRHVRTDDVSGEVFLVWRRVNFELKFRVQENDRTKP